MNRNITLTLTVFLSLILGACSTPQERCINNYTREYRIISSLLDEVEGNLARGYAWQEREVVRDRLTECRNVWRDRAGNVVVEYTPCWREYVDTERYRVPIDPVVEARKRDGLWARKDALSKQADENIAACKEAFPEEAA